MSKSEILIDGYLLYTKRWIYRIVVMNFDIKKSTPIGWIFLILGIMCFAIYIKQ